jgi:hypothetical protein
VFKKRVLCSQTASKEHSGYVTKRNINDDCLLKPKDQSYETDIASLSDSGIALTVLQYKQTSCGDKREQFMGGQPLSLWYRHRNLAIFFYQFCAAYTGLLLSVML